MKLSLWGVRGSMATPGPTTVRYGGNTTCLFVEAGDRLIVLDAGTGIRKLGESLMSRGPESLEIDMFLSHSHMDHICGFPFFAPLYKKENKINVHGRLHYEKSVEQVVASQMDYSYFPLRAVDLPSQIQFIDLHGEDVQLGEDVCVKYQMMNHPVLMQAYRIEYQGKSVIFSGDMEPYDDIFETDESQEVALKRNLEVVGFFKGADILVIDSTYTPEEYETHRGWGHNSIAHSVWFGGEAGVKQLVLTHHEPNRSDDQLDAMIRYAHEAQERFSYQFDNIEMAVEGREYIL